MSIGKKIGNLLKLIINGDNKLEGDIFIIGGGEIYEKFITLADEIYLTIIDCDVDGDTFFNLDSNGWIEISSESFKKDDKKTNITTLLKN